MSKNISLPFELKAFNNAFNTLVNKHEPTRIYDDFLTIVICCMARQTQEDLYLLTVKSYTREELNTFAKMFAELVIIYGENNAKHTWCDPLGDFYEELATRYKKSKLGQFFTPKSVCNLMAQFTHQPNQWGLKINDPCVGSGRLLLAANHLAPGNYFVAQDLDPICCKMAAINLCFHNVRAEVHCMNSLGVDKPFNSYAVNYNWHKNKVRNILITAK